MPNQPPLGGGDLLLVNRDASVQFLRPILFRLIRVLPYTTYDGWIWLDGYQVDRHGNAMKRREIFVREAGLRRGELPPKPRGRRFAAPAVLAGAST